MATCAFCGKKIGAFDTSHSAFGINGKTCSDCYVYAKRIYDFANDGASSAYEQWKTDFITRFPDNQSAKEYTEKLDGILLEKSTSVKAAEKERLEKEQLRRAIEEEKKQKAEEKKQEAEEEKIIASNAKEFLGGYFEYKVIVVSDINGSTDIKSISCNLNQLGKDGWRLVTAVTNEIGKNTNKVGYGGFSSGTNETVDETVLIFERFRKE